MKARIKNSGVGPTLPRRGLSLGSFGMFLESGEAHLWRLREEWFDLWKDVRKGK